MAHEFVYIPVPVHWASQIHRRLAELDEASAIGRDPFAPQQRDELLVARMYLEAQSEQRRLMLELAKSPEQWFTTAELARALGYPSSRVLAGLLGAFGRKAKNRYGGRTPWDSRWDSAAEVSRHSMRSEVAKTILATSQA